MYPGLMRRPKSSGRTQITPPGNPPITFEIRYDPARIQPSRTYPRSGEDSALASGSCSPPTRCIPCSPAGARTPSPCRCAAWRPPRSRLPVLKAAARPRDAAGDLLESDPARGQGLSRQAQRVGRLDLVLAAEGPRDGVRRTGPRCRDYELTGDAVKFSRMAATQMACRTPLKPSERSMTF